MSIALFLGEGFRQNNERSVQEGFLEKLTSSARCIVNFGSYSETSSVSLQIHTQRRASFFITVRLVKEEARDQAKV